MTSIARMIELADKKKGTADGKPRTRSAGAKDGAGNQGSQAAPSGSKARRLPGAGRGAVKGSGVDLGGRHRSDAQEAAGFPEFAKFIVRVPAALLERLEKTRAKRGLRSRNDVVVAILEEGVK